MGSFGGVDQTGREGYRLLRRRRQREDQCCPREYGLSYDRVTAGCATTRRVAALIATPAIAAQSPSTKTVTTKSGATKATTTVSTKGDSTTAKTTMTKAKPKAHKAKHTKKKSHKRTRRLPRRGLHRHAQGLNGQAARRRPSDSRAPAVRLLPPRMFWS